MPIRQRSDNDRPARLFGAEILIPHGLRLRRTWDTKALAAAFPFASAELEASGGIFLGRNATTGGLVFVDRFAMENHNQVILARSGAGKSYLAKVQILRSLYGGIEVLFAHTDAALGLRANTSGGPQEA